MFQDLTFAGLPDVAIMLILIVFVLCLSTGFVYMFTNEFRFDAIFLFTCIFMFFLSALDILDEIYSGIALFVFASYYYVKKNRSELE